MKIAFKVDPARSAQMSLVRARDTKPEMVVRRTLHRAGLRYRLHSKELPGKPDLVFPSRRIALFVHGCFWHRHPDPSCRMARLPKTRREFWLPKLEGNRRRDLKNLLQLRQMGWQPMVIWECQISNTAWLSSVVDQIRGS